MCVKVIQEGEILFLRNCEKWFKGGHALHILGGVSELLKKNYNLFTMDTLGSKIQWHRPSIYLHWYQPSRAIQTNRFLLDMHITFHEPSNMVETGEHCPLLYIFPIRIILKSKAISIISKSMSVLHISFDCEIQAILWKRKCLFWLEE